MERGGRYPPCKVPLLYRLINSRFTPAALARRANFWQASALGKLLQSDLGCIRKKVFRRDRNDNACVGSTLDRCDFLIA